MGAVANANSGSGSGTVPWLHVAGKGCLWLWVGAGMLQRDVHGVRGQEGVCRLSLRPWPDCCWICV